MNWLIYVLRNPRTRAVKYVGSTVRSLDVRLREHYDKALKSQGTRRDRGILSLLTIGAFPLIEAIESGCDDCDGFKKAEMRWIAFYRAQGADLWNATAGGQGTVGWGTPEEFRARADKTLEKFTPEMRSAAAAKWRQQQTPEERAAQTAKWRSSMTPDKRSAAATKANSETWRAVRSAANRKWRENQTPEERSAVARKGNASRTPEQVRAAVRKRNASRIPGQLSAAVKKWRDSQTPEERSAAAYKAWETKRAGRV